MTENNQKQQLTTQHPVQLVKIAIRELSVRSYSPPDPNISLENEAFNPKTTYGYGDFNTTDNSIQVFLAWQIGEDKPDSNYPAYLKVDIVGFFKIIDPTKFPPDKIIEFAKVNAPFILMPYVRAEVFNLSARAGFKPLMLSLMEVPVFKLVNEK
jgi:preprotein translocase subunit SecB